MSKETTNQGYIDALAYATDADNVDTPNRDYQEYSRGIDSYGLSQDGDSAKLNAVITADTVNDRIGVNIATPTKELQVHNPAGDSAIKLTNQTTGASVTDGFDINCAQTTSLVTLNQRENADIVVQLNGGERARFLAAGGMTFNGDTAAANALDDYEEGTFTPAFSNIGTGTYTTQVGEYTKIGNRVICDVEININALGTASGNLVVTNFPFTSAASTKGTTGSLYCPDFGVTAANMAGLIASSGTTVSLYKNSGDAGSTANITHADLNNGTVRFSITYKV